MNDRTKTLTEARTKAVVERIRSTVPILQVLAAFGYRVRDDGADREQQFACDLHGAGQDNKPSARVYPDSNSWYCVSKTARVLTARGWLLLEELAEVHPSVSDGTGVLRQPTAYWDRGLQPSVVVRTSAGYEVTVTADHEIEVVGRGWVPAAQIQTGDVLVVPRPKQMMFSQDKTLPCDIEDLNTRKYLGHPNLSLPLSWSRELGEVMGYIFGGGWVTPRPEGGSGVVGITSGAEDAEDARRIFRILQKWSSGRGCEVHRTGLVKTPNGNVYTEDQYVFTVGNDGFCEWFRRLGLGKDEAPSERRLPSSLWTAPKGAIRGFLRGLYATGGSVFRPKDRKGVRVNLYSVSQGFLQDVQLLLLQFGIYSRLHPPASTRPGGVWYLQLATGQDILVFRAEVGIANRRKSAVLESFQYNKRGSRNFKPVVSVVEPVGVLPVADISMPVEHSFVAGGIKVHNCFGCGLTRDAIETVKAKQGLKFWDAVRFLEKTYGLTPLPVDYGANDTPDARHDVAVILDATRTYQDDVASLQRFLDNRTADRDLPMDEVLRCWESFDKITCLVDEKEWSEDEGRRNLQRLREYIMDRLKECGSNGSA